MGTFDVVGQLRLRTVRSGFRAQYVLDVGISREPAGSIGREPLRWWHPLLRENASANLEPARFVVRDGTTTVRCVIVRPGGTLRAGRLDMFDADGAVLGRLRPRGAFGLSGYELRNPSGVAIGRIGGKPNPRSAAVDCYDRQIGELETIHFRNRLINMGLGRIEGVQRPLDHLQSSDPHELGMMITLQPIASPMIRLMMIAVAVHYRS